MDFSFDKDLRKIFSFFYIFNVELGKKNFICSLLSQSQDSIERTFSHERTRLESQRNDMISAQLSVKSFLEDGHSLVVVLVAVDAVENAGSDILPIKLGITVIMILILTIIMNIRMMMTFLVS